MSSGSVFDCSFSADDNHIISCSFDRCVKVWECGPYEPEDDRRRRMLPLLFDSAPALLLTFLKNSAQSSAATRT